MQAVIAIPPMDVLKQPGNASRTLLRGICGVPLLTRVIATAARAGAHDVLLLWPEDVPSEAWNACVRSRYVHGIRIWTLLQHHAFDPSKAEHWALISDLLEPEFFWLPWNWVTDRRTLNALDTNLLAGGWAAAARLSKEAVCNSAVVTGPELPAGGVSVISVETARQAERFTVAHSGKVLDGIYTSFNRRLCRPVVRSLSHTPVTPNLISLGGLLVACLSTLFFMRGFYWSYVAGALLFFVAGLFDEMDGMLARIKFAESPFGCWMETAVDGITWLLLFTGITVGLWHQYGKRELMIGVALVVGTALSLIITSIQRKRATRRDKPQEYLGRLYDLLEADSSSVVSRGVRQVQLFLKKGVIIHYVLLFTLLNLLPVFLLLGAIGSNVTWILAIYYNHKFFQHRAATRVAVEVR